MAVDETSNDLDENPNNNLGKDASNTTVKDTAPNQNQKSALVWPVSYTHLTLPTTPYV